MRFEVLIAVGILITISVDDADNRFIEALALTYQNTQHHIPKDHSLHSTMHKNSTDIIFSRKL